MFTVMVLAHILGDYLFQFNFIARWKARSILGVVAHGVIVTLTTVVCAVIVMPAWWPWALLIGLIHTAADVIRAQLIHARHPLQDLTYYLLDQAFHLLVIGGVVALSSAPPLHRLSGTPRWLADPRILTYLISYLLLLNPAWVLLRFTVRGVWGSQAAPHLGQGEKYGPMLERVLIASSILAGQYFLIPLVLIPRRLAYFRMQGNGLSVVLLRLTGHWAETLLSVATAVFIGLALRWV